MNRDEAELIAAKVNNNTDGMFKSVKIKSASLEIAVHRAKTGKTEHLGYVSYYHSNPFKHYYINALIWLRGKYRQWQQL